MTWEILIPVIAAGLSLLAIGLELLMHDREKAKAVEFAIRRKQREIKEFQKKKDTKGMMDANKELMGLMGKNFRLRMKTTFISLPLFIIILWILSSTLAIAPLQANAVMPVGVEIKNIQSSGQSVSVAFVSADIQLSGVNERRLDLKAKGNQGDLQQIWWNVSSSEGAKTYSINVSANNKSDEKSYSVNFVSPGSLTPGFSPNYTPASLLSNSVEVKPLYKGVEVNVFGIITLSWFWYYFFSYLILSALFSPLKNRVLWGHWKGVKHLEKLENEKNEAAKK